MKPNKEGNHWKKKQILLQKGTNNPTNGGTTKQLAELRCNIIMLIAQVC
uniref:Uncharacterized protein n=1 Tax=Arundo donax TaxID=35708 RepID=A0A0A9I3F5_ARUDO